VRVEAGRSGRLKRTQRAEDWAKALKTGQAEWEKILKWEGLHVF